MLLEYLICIPFKDILYYSHFYINSLLIFFTNFFEIFDLVFYKLEKSKLLKFFKS